MELNFNSKDKLCTGGRLIKLSGRPRESMGPPSLEALKTNVLRDTDVLDSPTGAGETSAGTFQPYIQLSCDSTNYFHHSIIHLFSNYAATTGIK